MRYWRFRRRGLTTSVARCRRAPARRAPPAASNGFDDGDDAFVVKLGRPVSPRVVEFRDHHAFGGERRALRRRHVEHHRAEFTVTAIAAPPPRFVRLAFPGPAVDVGPRGKTQQL